MGAYKVPHVYVQGTSCVNTGYHMYIYRVPRVYIRGTSCVYTGYLMCI